MFTPGPWYTEGKNPPRIYARDGLDIIAQCDSMGEMSRAEEKENAKLISAAPDMYNLLTRLNKQLKDSLHLHIGEIDELLSKINGGNNE